MAFKSISIPKKKQKTKFASYCYIHQITRCQLHAYQGPAKNELPVSPSKLGPGIRIPSIYSFSKNESTTHKFTTYLHNNLCKITKAIFAGEINGLNCAFVFSLFELSCCAFVFSLSKSSNPYTCIFSTTIVTQIQRKETLKIAKREITQITCQASTQ